MMTSVYEMRSEKDLQTENRRLLAISDDAPAQAISFRELVQSCAQDQQLVSAFNRLHGARLSAPVTMLVDDLWTSELSDEEQMEIVCFILFVHEHIWRRLKRARTKMLRTALIGETAIGR